MKSASFRAIICLLLLSGSTVQASNPESLLEAIRTGKVKAVIRERVPDSTSQLNNSYYGPCMDLALRNFSGRKLSLSLESGSFLQPADTSEQRMMVTLDQLISLDPGSNRRLKVYAMCTQMHHRSPGRESLLSMTKLAEGNLLELARFISKNRLQDDAAQQAVWVLTDNNDMANIYGNVNEMKLLIDFVSKLTGKPKPAVQQQIEYASGIVSGEILFENSSPESYTLVLLDEEGTLIATYFENREIDRPVWTTLSWKFRYKGFPKGVYYVRLTNREQQLVASRPVIVD